MISFKPWNNICLSDITNRWLAYKKKIKSAVDFRLPLAPSISRGLRVENSPCIRQFEALGEILYYFQSILMSFREASFLSLLRSSTKLKSPPIIISSQWKLDKWSKKARKKFGSSSLGTYMLAKVKGLLFVSMSQIMKRPFGSEKTLRICKLKVLLKRMLTPALLLEQQLKSVL